MYCCNLRAVFTGMILVMAVSGCASLGMLQTAEERVEERAQERLNALLRRDIALSFSYVAPGLRASTSWQDHSYRYGGIKSWTAATVESVACSPDKCDVSISVDYQLMRLRLSNTRSLEEVWIKVDGQWYLYYD